MLLQNKLCFCCFFRCRSQLGDTVWDGEGAGAVIDGLVLMDSLTELLLSAASAGERLGGTYPCFQSYFSVVQMGSVHKCECKKHSLFSRSDGAVQCQGDKSCSLALYGSADTSNVHPLHYQHL